MEIYSKRQKLLRGEITDVLQYDVLPSELRLQILYIIEDATGVENSDYSQNFYKQIYNKLIREYGVHLLVNSNYFSYSYQVKGFIENQNNIDRVLDAIELCFQTIESMSIGDRMQQMTYGNLSLSAESAIILLNKRFRENGVGFCYQGGEIIKIDSTVIHQEVVLPTIKLLNNQAFQGANDEYMSAHEHYRHGRNKECLVDCLKAFESVLKTICTTKEWAFDETRDTASKLIDICFQNGLIPAYAQNQFTSLKQLLVTGIPTVRNRNAGHGQGVEPQEVDDEIVRYGLNLTGSNIIFLIELSKI